MCLLCLSLFAGAFRSKVVNSRKLSPPGAAFAAEREHAVENDEESARRSHTHGGGETSIVKERALRCFVLVFLIVFPSWRRKK
jgi:hypothetical protein